MRLNVAIFSCGKSVWLECTPVMISMEVWQFLFISISLLGYLAVWLLSVRQYFGQFSYQVLYSLPFIDCKY